jgi:hypothetical protein
MKTYFRLSAVGTLLLSLALAVGTRIVTPAFAANTTYYVDCSAGSNGNGTQSSPWNNLATVNATTFGSGDSILFKRGTTCSGSLWPKGSGTNGSPITLDTYGTGPLPIINGGSNQYAFQLSDQEYWQVQNLEFTGGTRYGIFLTVTSGTKSYFRLNNLVVHDMASGGNMDSKNTGLVVVSPTTDSSNSTNAKFNDVILDNVTAYNTTMWSGIVLGSGTGSNSWAPNVAKRSTNMTVRNSTAHDTWGDGIVVWVTSNGLIENSVAYRSGLQPTKTIGTPNGLWTWACNNCTAQNNEAYSNDSPSFDGGNYDIDYFSADNNVQYNYGHDALGYCISVFGASSSTTTNSVVRYNICANNARDAAYVNRQGDIFLDTWQGGRLDGVQVYNNTVYWNPAANYPAVKNTAAYGSTLPNFFKNNIIYSTVSQIITCNGSVTYDYNLYWYTGAGSPVFCGTSGWGGYASKEPHSIYADPQLNSPSYHGVGMPTTEFTLQSGSPAINAGVDVCVGISGCSMGSQDFFGNVIPQGGSYDIGANESSGTAPTNTPVGPTATPTSTNTPAPPTNTPTHTPTPAPTNTPTAGPSPTPTNTNTPVPPTNTPTRTNTPASTNTPGGSGISFIQTVGSASCSTTSLTITVPAGGVPAGHTLIARSTMRSSSAGTGSLSVSDSKGNTYTLDLDFVESTGHERAALFHTTVTTALAGGDTITASYPGISGSTTAFVVSEFAGLSATNPVDASAAAGGNSATPSVSTTTNASDLVYAVVGTWNAPTYTEAAGWTTDSHLATNCGGAGGSSTNHGAYKIVSTTGTYTYNPTLSSGNYWVDEIVAYK